MNNIWHTKDAVSHIFTDEAILYLIQKDPRYIEPTIEGRYMLSWRLLFDCRHDTGGGKTEIFAIYINIDDSVLLRRILIKRGSFGYFNEDKDIEIKDTNLSNKVYQDIKDKFIKISIPPIDEGSEDRTNIDYVEIEWIFERTRREVGWQNPNNNMINLQTMVEHIAAKLRKEFDPNLVG